MASETVRPTKSQMFMTRSFKEKFWPPDGRFKGSNRGFSIQCFQSLVQRAGSVKCSLSITAGEL